jgi:pimeloyl-ACP methyl ester carboxylesterase
MAMFMTSDGTDIRYERRGAGPAVVVCHGGPSNVCDTMMRDIATSSSTTWGTGPSRCSPIRWAGSWRCPVDDDNAPYLMKAMGALDLRGRLGSIRCPALVLYGSRDAGMVAGGQMLASGLPDADVRVLPDVGHEVFVEAPTDTFDTLRRFLASR